MLLTTMMCAITCFAVATPPSDLSKELELMVRKQENAFQQKDAAFIRKHTVANHVSVTPFHQCYSQKNLLKALPKFNITSHKVTNVRVISISKDVAVVSYVFEFTGTFAGRPFPTRTQVLSTWVRQGKTWAEATYQQTLLKSSGK